MSIYEIRTVKTPTVMPPKAASVTLKPVRSFAEDAAICNQRLVRNTQGRAYATTQESRFPSAMPNANAARIAQAAARRAMLAQEILPHLPAKITELERIFGISRKVISKALHLLEEHGKVEAHGSQRVWRVTNG